MVTHRECDCKDYSWNSKKYDDLKLDFGFLHSIEYFNCLLRKQASFWPQGTLNATERTKPIPYYRL